MLKRKIILIFCVILLGILIYPLNPEIAYGCSYFSPENWWYEQAYEFDPNLFPDGVELEIDYSRTLIGQFTIINWRDDNLYLITQNLTAFQNMSSGDEIDDKIVEFYGKKLTAYDVQNFDDSRNPLLFEWLFPYAEWINENAAGGIKGDVPLPQKTDIRLVSGGVLYSIPVTITYKLNPAYVPDRVVAPSTIADRTIASIAVVEGMAKAENNEITDDHALGSLVLDTATFTIDRWLKGSGPTEIKVESFGYGPDCNPRLPPDTPAILFLGEEIGDGHFTLLETYYPEQIVNVTAAPEIEHTLAQSLEEFNPEESSSKAYSETQVEFSDSAQNLENDSREPVPSPIEKKVDTVTWLQVAVFLCILIGGMSIMRVRRSGGNSINSRL